MLDRIFSERGLRGAIAGGAAAAIALAVGELGGGLTSQSSGLVVAVGGLVIDLVPPAVKDFGIGVFGTADKPALVIGIVVLSVLFGTILGRVAAHRYNLQGEGGVRSRAPPPVTMCQNGARPNRYRHSGTKTGW